MVNMKIRYTPDFAKFSDVDETKGIIKNAGSKNEKEHSMIMLFYIMIRL